VVDPDQSLSSESLRLITQTAHLASFYVVRDRLEASVSNRVRDDLVRDVVQREVISTALIAARARSVGLAAGGGYEVLLADLDAFEEKALSGEERAQALKRGLLDRVITAARDVRSDAVTVAIGDAVLALLPRSPRQSRATELAARIVDASTGQEPELAVSVGIGTPVSGLEELADSYDRAGLAVRVAQTALGGRSVADFATLGSYLVLLPGVDADVVLSESVRRLIDYDRKQGTDYAVTLEVFLDAFGNRAASAARLHVHINTLVYRLRRIEELAGFDFNDGDARLAAQLELHRLRLAGWRPQLSASTGTSNTSEPPPS